MLRYALVFLSVAAVATGADFTTSRCDARRAQTLRQDGTAACACIGRALYALGRYRAEIPKYFGTKLNFGVFLRNPDFYLKRLGNRNAACQRGKIPFQCVGVCGTEQGTQAYVKVTFGFVGKTIHVCDEFFGNDPASRREILDHEYGRLEGIGDAPGLEPNNIYVWDNIIRPLCSDQVLKDLEKLHGG